MRFRTVMGVSVSAILVAEIAWLWPNLSAFEIGVGLVLAALNFLSGISYIFWPERSA